MSTRSAMVNGARLVYDDHGNGPLLVFLHGGAACATYWENLLPLFIDDHRCIAVDFIGHGRSDRATDRRYGIARQVDDLTELLEHTVGPAVLVGASAGAGTALGVAAARPDLVRAVYCEDAVPSIYTRSWTSTDAIIGLFAAIGNIAALRGHDDGLVRYAAALGNIRLGPLTLFDAIGPERVQFMARISEHTDPAWYDAITDPANSWPDEHADHVATRVSCPVHIAHGDSASGGLVAVSDIEHLRRLGLGVTATHIPGAGHVITPWHTRTIHHDLRAFLDRAAS